MRFSFALVAAVLASVVHMAAGAPLTFVSTLNVDYTKLTSFHSAFQIKPTTTWPCPPLPTRPLPTDGPIEIDHVCPLAS